jgi:hypothetical protein
MPTTVPLITTRGATLMRKLLRRIKLVLKARAE